MFLISISLPRNGKLLLISDRITVDKIAKIFVKSSEIIGSRCLLRALKDTQLKVKLS